MGAGGGAGRVDGIPSVAVRDSDVIPAPVFGEGRAVLLVTDHDSSRNATVVVEGRTGWSRGPGPWGTVQAFTAIGSTPVSYTHLDVYKRQMVGRWVSASATASRISAYS